MSGTPLLPPPPTNTAQSYHISRTACLAAVHLDGMVLRGSDAWGADMCGAGASKLRPAPGECNHAPVPGTYSPGWTAGATEPLTAGTQA